MKRFILSLAIALLALPALADQDLDCQVVAEAINPTEAQVTDDFINLTDGTVGLTAGAEDEFTVPVEVQVWGLRADIDVAPAGTDTWDIYVVDDGTNTLVHCEILGTATSCVNVNNIATVAAGSDLTVVVDSGDGTGAPDLAAELRVSFCIDLDR